MFVFNNLKLQIPYSYCVVFDFCATEHYHSLVHSVRNYGRHEDPFVESYIEIVVDNEPLGEDGDIVLGIVIIFIDEKELFAFDKRYANVVGFPMSKRNLKKGNDRIVRYVTFICSHEGRRSSNTSITLKSQPTSQTDCKTKISAFLDNLETWRINIIHFEHNH